MEAVSVWMPAAGIPRADVGSICAILDKISTARASGCQLFLPGSTADCSAGPDCFSAGGWPAPAPWSPLVLSTLHGVCENISWVITLHCSTPGT